MTTNDVISELNDHGFQDLSPTRLLSFVNDVYYEICHQPWPDLEGVGSVAQITGNPAMQLPTDARGTVNKLLWVEDITNSNVLVPERAGTLYKNYGTDLTTTAGLPTNYYYIGRTPKLYPVPSAGLTLNIGYTITPTPLDTTTNLTPVFPVQYHRLLVLGAIVKCNMLNDDLPEAQVYQGEYNRRFAVAMEDIWSRQYDRPDRVVDLSSDTYFYG